MSLWITVEVRDEHGNRQPIDFEPDNLHLGGFESSRYEFWGHPVMRELGLAILPMLGDGFNLAIEGEELDDLAQEAYMIQENADQIIAATQHNEDFVIFHTNNVLHAVEEAKRVDGMFTMG